MVVSPAGSRAMIMASAKKYMCVHYLYIYRAIAMIFEVVCCSRGVMLLKASA